MYLGTLKIFPLKLLILWLPVLGRWSGRIIQAVLLAGLVAEVHSIYL